MKSTHLWRLVGDSAQETCNAILPHSSHSAGISPRSTILSVMACSTCKRLYVALNHLLLCIQVGIFSGNFTIFWACLASLKPLLRNVLDSVFLDICNDNE